MTKSINVTGSSVINSGTLDITVTLSGFSGDGTGTQLNVTSDNPNDTFANLDVNASIDGAYVVSVTLDSVGTSAITIAYDGQTATHNVEWKLPTISILTGDGQTPSVVNSPAMAVLFSIADRGDDFNISNILASCTDDDAVVLAVADETSHYSVSVIPLTKGIFEVSIAYAGVTATHSYEYGDPSISITGKFLSNLPSTDLTITPSTFATAITEDDVSFTPETGVTFGDVSGDAANGFTVTATMTDKQSYNVTVTVGTLSQDISLKYVDGVITVTGGEGRGQRLRVEAKFDEFDFDVNAGNIQGTITGANADESNFVISPKEDVPGTFILEFDAQTHGTNTLTVGFTSTTNRSEVATHTVRWITPVTRSVRYDDQGVQVVGHAAVVDDTNEDIFFYMDGGKWGKTALVVHSSNTDGILQILGTTSPRSKVEADKAIWTPISADVTWASQSEGHSKGILIDFPATALKISNNGASDLRYGFEALTWGAS